MADIYHTNSFKVLLSSDGPVYTIVRAPSEISAAFETCHLGLFGDEPIGDVWIIDAANIKYHFTVYRYPVIRRRRITWPCAARDNLPSGFTQWFYDLEQW